MKVFVALCLALAVVQAAPQQKYTTRYDGINVPEILGNRRLLIPYLKCALDTGRCSPEGKELKSHIKEALEDHCAKCTETQRKGVHQVIGHLINNEPEYWKQLAAKFDPQRKYVTQYESELRAIA